jgi:hypothetical protein
MFLVIPVFIVTAVLELGLHIKVMYWAAVPCLGLFWFQVLGWVLSVCSRNAKQYERLKS